MSSSFLLSSSVFVVFAIAAAAAASGGSGGAMPPGDDQTAAAQPAQPAAAPPSTPTTVTIIPNAKVTDAFKKGQPMLETGEYKINAGRRDAPGAVEIHTRDTDVFYILDGSAVLLTGGTVQDQKTVAPNEIRGSSISGGESHTMNKGDVIVIPRGVPHWIKEVPQAPLLYFVVKTVAPEGTK